MLEGKRLLIGISGSIAAYKTAALTRLFVKAGAEVRVVMTPASTAFVTPLTLATLSKQPVYSAFVKGEAGEWTNHVDLGLWADLMIIAPLTANTLGKMANGICDNLLLATYLSARCPVVVAPAMDLDMYQHPTTTQNLHRIQSFGNHVLAPGTGELASGLHGQGRMAEPEEIFEWTERFFSMQQALKGKTVLVTAGPTYEAIDPVRFIGNHSSGKMGFAIAEAFAMAGAKVILVSGPTHEQISHSNIQRVNVQSAEEMFQAASASFEKCDIAVMSAAVADYTPVVVREEKIKKSGDTLSIELRKTKDILASLGQIKKPGQYLVGFALETNNEEANAVKKLKEKNADLMVMNSLRDAGAGFGHDTNRVTMIPAKGEKEIVELKSKKAIAGDLVAYVVKNAK